jgi:hypothetical protein
VSTHLWFKEDIRNILLSAQVTCAMTAQCAPSASMLMYLRGCQAALTAVALACGIPPDEVTPKVDEDAGRRSANLGEELSLWTADRLPRDRLELSVTRDSLRDG